MTQNSNGMNGRDGRFAVVRMVRVVPTAVEQEQRFILLIPSIFTTSNLQEAVMQKVLYTIFLAFGAFAGQVLAQSLVLTQTYQKIPPVPVAAGDMFGYALAGAGDKAVIGVPEDDTGAPNAGAVYVFSTATGALLRKISNPNPPADAEGNLFGFAVAMVGNHVLVGAPFKNSSDGAFVEAGAAYLFDGDTGFLLHSFADPTPDNDEQFGFAVAGLGTNVLVGSPFDNANASAAGAVHLFNGSSGAWIRTFANPSPAPSGDEFGKAIASAGSNVLVGAPNDNAGSGTAYLFDGSTGGLIFTFLNPTPPVSGTDLFGKAVAVAGEHLVVAAPLDDATGIGNAGAVYLFSGTTGNLLQTLLKPAPRVQSDQFGDAVSGVGTNGLVLIGAPMNDAGALNAGSAYLFSASGGALLQTFNIPGTIAHGNTGDNFGFSVAGIGNKILLGTPNDDIVGVANTGTAYLYVSPNGAPNAHAGTDQTFECNSPAGTSVTLDGSGSIDPDNDPLVYTWRENGNLIAPPSNSPTAIVSFDLGSHTIELTVEDGKGGLDADVVLITIGDATPPTITLNGANPMILECSKPYVEPGATVSDACDPAPTLAVAGEVNANVVGAYVITYTATDARGHSASATRTVNVVDTTPPVITLNGANPMTLACGNAYSEAGAVVADACDAAPTLAITGEVNSNVSGTYTMTYTATDASNNTASLTRSVNVDCPLPFPFVLLADEKVLIDHHLASQGDIHSNYKIEIRDGNPSTHTGNLTAVNNIIIKKKNTIAGNVTAGGNLSLEAGAIVTGTATSNAAVAIFPLPTFYFDDGSTNVAVPANTSLSLAPGSYFDVTVAAGGNLLLTHTGNSGEYFFHKLDLKTLATLSVNVSQGPVKINLVQKFHFEQSVQFVITPATAASTKLLTINVKGSDDLHIHENSHVSGTINAPRADIILYDEVFFKGAIAAEKIEVRKNVTCLHHDSGTSLAKSTIPSAGEAKESDGSETTAKIKTYQLEQNYPNPFNPDTEIRFQLPEASHALVKIFNNLGEEVRTLADREFAAGLHSLRWNAKNDRGEKVQSGIYFYRLVTPKFSETRKMVLTK